MCLLSWKFRRKMNIKKRESLDIALGNVNAKSYASAAGLSQERDQDQKDEECCRKPERIV